MEQKNENQTLFPKGYVESLSPEEQDKLIWLYENFGILGAKKFKADLEVK